MIIDFDKINFYYNEINESYPDKNHKNNDIEKIASQKISDLKIDDPSIKLSLKKTKQKKNKNNQISHKKSVARNDSKKFSSQFSNREGKLKKITTIYNHFENLKKLESSKNLESFIQLFPKGGDTHCHLTGAININDYIKLAQAKKLRFTISYDHKEIPSFTFYKNSEIGESSSQSSAEFSSNSNLKKAFIAATTCRGNKFFETFSNFESIDRHLALSDYLLPLLKRAYRANILYLEVSKGFEVNDWDDEIKSKLYSFFPESKLCENEDYKKKLKNINLNEIFNLLVPHLNIKKICYITYLNEAEEFKIPSDLRKKGFKNSLFSLNNPVVVRLNGDVNRELPLPEFFADLTLAFLLAQEEIEIRKNEARLLGVVLSGREFQTQSFVHLKTHLRMIHFLRSKFPQVHCSLHAGELSEKNATPEQMSSAIHPTLKDFYSSSNTRIGHGTCILHDKKLEEILKVPKGKLPCFEICPTSNEIILGITKKEHSLVFLLKNNIPITLNTDDPGVLRTNLTNEFIKAINWFPNEINYETLKSLARNQIRYSFLPGEEIFKKKHPYQYKLLSCFKKLKLNAKNKSFLANSPKGTLQFRLEKSFAKFEGTFISHQKEVLIGNFLSAF